MGERILFQQHDIALAGLGETLLKFAFVCAILRFASIGWFADSVVIIVIAQLLHAATFGAHHAASIGLVSAWFGDGRRASGQALYGSLTYGAGGMLGSLVSGVLWDAVGPAWTFTFASLAGAVGLAVLAAYVVGPWAVLGAIGLLLLR